MIHDNVKNVNKRILKELLHEENNEIKYPAKMTVVQQVAHEIKYGKFNNYESDIVFEIKDAKSNYIKSTNDALTIISKNITIKNRFAIQVDKNDIFVIIQDWNSISNKSILDNIDTSLFG